MLDAVFLGYKIRTYHLQGKTLPDSWFLIASIGFHSANPVADINRQWLEVMNYFGISLSHHVIQVIKESPEVKFYGYV